MSTIIHPLLVSIKNELTFVVDSEDLLESMRVNYDKNEDCDMNNARNYIIDDMNNARNYIVDEMIWTFNEIRNIDSKPVKCSTLKEIKEKKERIQNGTTLFGKYFYYLWV